MAQLTFLCAVLLLCTAAISNALVNSELHQYSAKIGDTTINITKEVFVGDENYAFLNLHENENTSVVSARSFLLNQGGSIVKFAKGNTRTVSFKVDGTTYTVDPNRIFTPEGIESTLKTYGPYSEEAAAQVSVLANTLLSIYEFEKQDVVLALHNNGNTYGANSYLPGGPYENDAEKVNIVDGTNPSDFFFVIDPYYYNTLAEMGYNVVLQNNATVSNDGSLSYYCGLQGKTYLNFEAVAETTAFGQQVVVELDMIQAAKRAIVAKK